MTGIHARMRSAGYDALSNTSVKLTPGQTLKMAVWKEYRNITPDCPRGIDPTRHFSLVDADAWRYEITPVQFYLDIIPKADRIDFEAQDLTSIFDDAENFSLLAGSDFIEQGLFNHAYAEPVEWQGLGANRRPVRFTERMCCEFNLFASRQGADRLELSLFRLTTYRPSEQSSDYVPLELRVLEEQNGLK